MTELSGPKPAEQDEPEAAPRTSGASALPAGKVKRRGAESRWGRFGEKNHLWRHIDDHRWESVCKRLMFHRAGDMSPQVESAVAVCGECLNISER